MTKFAAISDKIITDILGPAFDPHYKSWHMRVYSANVSAWGALLIQCSPT